MRRRAMPRRMGRPGLLGTAARTAVVAGTASAVVGGVQHRQESKYDQQQAAPDQQAALDQQQADLQQQQAAFQQQQQMAAMQQQGPPVPPQQGAPAAESAKLDRIKQLGEMKDQGLLTDQEFAAEKARILAT